jgi:hypothetical protein
LETSGRLNHSDGRLSRSLGAGVVCTRALMRSAEFPLIAKR